MLRALTIRDMVLIETAELEFDRGLNVLTGETGAGKSILLDSLGFVLGWRVRSGLVRGGADQGEVVAEFQVDEDHPVNGVLEDAGVPVDDALLLRRTMTTDGRRQAWVNDRRVTAETLRSLSAGLVELHGQQDDRGLLDPRGHRVLLDGFAGTAPDLAAVGKAWETRKGVQDQLDAARAAQAEAERDAEFLRHAVGELDQLAPVECEEPELDGRRRQLRAAEQIRQDVARAAEAVGPEGAEGALVQAGRWLEGAADKAEGALDPILDGLGRVLAELAEVTTAVEHLQHDLGGEPGELEAVEERLFAIRGLARKHQVEPDALAGLAEDFRSRLQAIDGAEEEVGRLEAELAGAGRAYDAAAASLSETRREAAKRLDAQMAKELKPLKLERAVFETQVEAADPGPEGVDRIRFAAATNPGAPMGPIDRIASGGELSRFLLALKVCLSGGKQDVTLIFDEIDRGVGGATADAVGKRLRMLGADAQVVVVTHSPQVAARGGHHWRVGKSVGGDGATRTEVLPLSEPARVEEIARMLAGDVITSGARAAARALLEPPEVTV